MKKFPKIENINDLLPFIKDNINMVVNQKNDYIVIDYLLNTPDTFTNEYDLECRGIIFDTASGKLLRRPLHKFFNYNERPETQNVDFSKPHVILEKLDGSMIVPFYNSDGRLIWGSKAGETFLTPQVEEFVNLHPEYDEFARNCIQQQITPIFEWCSRKNRIVIDYPEDRLVLIAIRDNVFDGNYVPYLDMIYMSDSYKIEVVGICGSFESMEELAVYTKDLKGKEGFVVRFDDDGLWIKVKADEYLKFHRAKDSFNSEKAIINILVSGIADDFRTSLSDDDRKLFEKFEKDFWQGFNSVVSSIINILFFHVKRNTTRKDFALNYKPIFTNQNLVPVIFRFFGEDPKISDVKEEVLKIIAGSCSSQTKVDEKRGLWGNLKWHDYYHMGLNK